MLEFMFNFLNWGFVWDGRRPVVYSEVNGHVALSLFLTFSCLNMRPSSAR